MKIITTNKKRIVFALLTIATMVCIFIFSCENSDNSSETSGRFVKIALKIFYSGFEDMSAAEQAEILSSLSHIIRKTAHFTIFAALGFFSSMTVGRRRAFGKASLAVLIFCFAYAVSDEFHQYFVPGRACMLADILLDTLGSAGGISLSLLLLNRKRGNIIEV